MRFSKIVVLALTMAFGAVALFAARKGAEFRMNEKVLFSVEVTSEYGQERIESWRSDEAEFFVFLPSYADLAKTKLYQNRPGEVTIDGEPIINGMTCENFQWNTPYELTCRIAGENPETRITFMKSDNIPTMYIDTRSGNMDYIHKKKGNEETGKIRLYTDEGKIDYAGDLDKISGRGNATWTNSPKKPYNIVLQKAGDLLEMGAAQKWILLANALDDTNLRNKIVLDFAKAIDLAYSPQGEWVDLYLNGEYAGLYLLCERNEVHPQRVDLSTSGSFLVSTDLEERLAQKKVDYIKTDNQIALRLHYAAISKEKIRTVFQSAENAILAEDGIDSVTRKNWKELIDAESWAKKYLLEEAFGNLDAGLNSQFYYYDGDNNDKKIYAGPVWDYDMCMGNPSNEGLKYPSQYFAGRKHIWGNNVSWLFELYQKDDFEKLVKDFYVQYRTMLIDMVENRVSTYAYNIRNAAYMNAQRWNTSDEIGFDEYVKKLQEYMRQRVSFLDDIFINDVKYYRVEAFLPGWVVTSYAVLPGNRLPVFFPIENTADTVILGWYTIDGDKPFDISQPICEDASIYLKFFNLEQGTND